MTESPSAWATHPWVAQAVRGVRFGIAWGAQDPTSSWSETQEFVQRVEALGFDSYWAIDHPMAPVSGADCWTTLAALAACTRTIRLGPLVSCIYYRRPALLARMAADVDRISGGRLILGLGIGDSAPEFQRLGIPLPPVPERQRALDETIAIVRGLWGSEPFTFAGGQFQVTDGQTVPGPIQQPYVPLLIAGGGERVTLRQVARYADASNFGAHRNIGGATDDAAIVRKLDALRVHCEAEGRSTDSVLKTHTTMLLFLAESEAALQAKLAEVPEGRRTGFAPSTMAGTPKQAIQYFRALAALGMQYFICFIHPKDVETAELLAREVVPAVQAATAP